MACQDCPGTNGPGVPEGRTAAAQEAFRRLSPRLRPVVARLELLRDQDPQLASQINTALAALLPADAAPTQTASRPLAEQTFSCPQCKAKFSVDVARRVVTPLPE